MAEKAPSANSCTSLLKFVISCRMQLSVLALLGCALSYMTRMSMSSGLVCMVNQTATQDTAANSSNHGDATCPAVDNSTDSNSNEGEFLWSKTEQGLVLGAFFWGYLISQLPAAYLVTKVSGISLTCVGLLSCGLLMLITPALSNTGAVGAIVVRVLTGACNGLYMPGLVAIWSGGSMLSIPLLVSSVFGYRVFWQVGLAMSGCQIGCVISLAASGFICETIGWQYIFYIFGIACILWSALFLLVMTDYPVQMSRISKQELDYIEDSLDGQASLLSDLRDNKVPWGRVVRSVPVWALVLVTFGSACGTYLVGSELPTWMSEVLRFNIEEDGLLSALPYILYVILANLSSALADWLRSRNYLSTTATRKLFEGIAMVCQAGFLMLAGVFDCHNPAPAVAAITISQGVSALKSAGEIVNALDIAPCYAATLQTITASVSMCAGIAMPSVASALTPQGTQHEWSMVFFLAGGIMLVFLLVFLLFGSGELQPWAQTTKAADAKGMPPKKESRHSLISLYLI